MNEENKSPEPTPEQLLKMLDIQMAASRQRRESGAVNRGSGRIVALCAIVFGAAIALWVLMYLLEEMRPVKEEGGLPAAEPAIPGAVTPPATAPASPGAAAPGSATPSAPAPSAEKPVLEKPAEGSR